MLRISLIALVLLLQVAFCQQFNGSFVDAANGITINLQQNGGALQGVLIGPNGQWQLQGNSQQSSAAGVVQSQQGFLGSRRNSVKTARCCRWLSTSWTLTATPLARASH